MLWLGYLKNSPDKCLLYLDYGHHRVTGFLDADWVGSPTSGSQ